jgi:hypothetical protein
VRHLTAVCARLVRKAFDGRNRQVAENDEERERGSLSERARSVLASVGQDDRVRQATAATRQAAARAQQASKNVTRAVGQQDAWDELRGDTELLTELARAHHALILDLVDRVSALESRTGGDSEEGHGD